MRNLFLLLFFTFTLNSCCNDNDNDTLPPATQTGANTAGCLVNGKVLLPYREGAYPALSILYEYSNGAYYFTMFFSDQRGTTNEIVSVSTFEIELEENETYILNQSDDATLGGRGRYSTSFSNQYNTILNHTGELTITRLDPSNSIISGTFWFDAINEQGETVQIREGRFDVNLSTL